MDKVFKTYRATVKEVNAEEGTIDLMIPISSNQVDRDGEIIDPIAFKKTIPKFMKHPVLVASHDYRNLTNQIGEWTKLKVEESGVSGKPKYYINAGNEQADWAFYLASKGVAAYSVGFIPVKWEDGKDEKSARRTYQEVELLEISQVIIPSNRQAVMDMRSKSVDPVIQELIDDITNAEIVDLTDEQNGGGSELRGGEGSGNFGHEGRPGEVGGSGGGGGSGRIAAADNPYRNPYSEPGEAVDFGDVPQVTLVGSERQVAWGNEIREDVIPDARDYMQVQHEELVTWRQNHEAGDPQTMAKENRYKRFEGARVAMEQSTSAKWFIENGRRGGREAIQHASGQSGKPGARLIDFGKAEKGQIVTKPEETDDFIRIPVRECEVTSTIDISKKEGISALYCGKEKQVRTYLFRKDKGWDMEKAKQWVKEHDGKGVSSEEEGITVKEDNPRPKPVSQSQIVDEIDYLKSLIDKVGAAEATLKSLNDSIGGYLKKMNMGKMQEMHDMMQSCETMAKKSKKMAEDMMAEDEDMDDEDMDDMDEERSLGSDIPVNNKSDDILREIQTTKLGGK